MLKLLRLVSGRVVFVTRLLKMLKRKSPEAQLGSYNLEARRLSPSAGTGARGVVNLGLAL